jgi:small subunit ribosomal protein S20
LPHTKSAKKRVRVSERRRARNRPIKSQVKTYIKRAEELILEDELDVAEKAVRQAISALDKAARKGIIHPNNAARRKSRLVKKLNKAKTIFSGE